jgi:hypothetical protein
MDDFPEPQDLLADARRDFAELYLVASHEDAMLMDGLVMAHAALVVGINAPRECVAPVMRDGLERTCDAAGGACSRVSDGERFAIEKVVFGVRVPET